MNMKHSTPNVWKLLKIALVANILEAYEFLIYAYLAIIMGQLFFASSNSLVALINVWTVFAISYIARPLGSVCWGLIGDRIGRGYSIQAALLTMAIPTVLIGLLPTYDQIGFWATAGLFILRFCQVFSSGGELPVSGCYVFEKSAKGKQRSLLCSTVVVSSIIGYLGASLVATVLFWSFEEAVILKWAWRIPYLLSIPITLWIWHIRKGLIESKNLNTDFPTVESVQTSSSWNITLITSSFLPMLLISAFMQILSYVFFVWMPVFLIHFIHIPSKIAYLLNTLSLIAWGSFALLAAVLSRFFGYKRIIVFHILASLLLIYPLFKGLQNASYITLGLIHLVFAWLPAGISGTIIEVLGGAFPVKVRALGMSLGLTLSATIFGGVTPLLLTYLIDRTGELMVPAFYIMAFGLVALPLSLKFLPASKPDFYGQEVD